MRLFGIVVRMWIKRIAGAVIAMWLVASVSAQEKVLAGSMYGSADPAVTASAVLGHVESGALAVDQMLGPEYDLDHIDEGIARAVQGNEGRILILPGAADPDDR